MSDLVILDRQRRRSGFHGGRHARRDHVNRRSRQPGAERTRDRSLRPMRADVVAAAEKKMTNATPPSGSASPDRARVAAPRGGIQRRGAAPAPGQLEPLPDRLGLFRRGPSSTPVMIFGSRYQGGSDEPARARGSVLVTRPSGFRQLVRLRRRPLHRCCSSSVTPENGRELLDDSRARRGAYSRRGDSRDQARQIGVLAAAAPYCGDNEVTPIHPFVLEQRGLRQKTRSPKASTSSIRAPFGPQCESVKLVPVFRKRIRRRGETRVVDPRHRAADRTGLRALSVTLATSGSWPRTSPRVLVGWRRVFAAPSFAFADPTGPKARLYSQHVGEIAMRLTLVISTAAGRDRGFAVFCTSPRASQLRAALRRREARQHLGQGHRVSKHGIPTATCTSTPWTRTARRRSTSANRTG